MKKIANLILPIITTTGLLIALLNYWTIGEIKHHKEELISIDKRMNKAEENLEILGESASISYEDLLEENERENKILKESTLEFSPSKNKTAYLQHKLTTDIKEIGDGDYTSLVVEQNEQKETVFQSNFRLSRFEWLDDKEIAAYQGCGTECIAVYVVDTESKEYQELNLGVGYTWSPDKQYVLAYHYSYQYGISVTEMGREYGRTIFQIRRYHPQDGSRLANQTKAAWSGNSTKLALIIRKENEEKLELLVFNVKQNFKLVLQQDLTGDDLTGLGWDNQRTISYTIEGKAKKVGV